MKTIPFWHRHALLNLPCYTLGVISVTLLLASLFTLALLLIRDPEI